MAKPRAVEPVKLILGLLWTDATARDASLALTQDRFGPIDYSGPDRPFDATNYYDAEMGGSPQRRLLAFRELFPPEQISQAKLACNEIEDRLAVSGGRRVNLDIGYLDHNKVVLASCKFAGQKIHLAAGVYADLIARYSAGRYQPFDWTFPDFKTGRYDEELGEIRQQYLAQLRARRTNREVDA